MQNGYAGADWRCITSLWVIFDFKEITFPGHIRSGQSEAACDRLVAESAEDRGKLGFGAEMEP
jgi:hypothetical protein